MTISVQRILSLIEYNKINAYKLESQANLSVASVQAWKSGKAKPSADALLKIADYFDVSVDYLLGRTGLKEKNATQITEQSEATIIYQKLSLENKQRMLDYGNLLLQSEQLEEKPKIKNTKFN